MPQKTDEMNEGPTLLKYRLLWFGALWALSVLALGVVATIIKFVLQS